MKGLKFMVMTLVILVTSVPCHAEYKKLIRTWEEWTPPAYENPKISGKSIDIGPAERKNNERTPSGYGIWKSTIPGILDKGRFFQPGTLARGEKNWDIQKAKAALGPVLRLEDLERIGLARNSAILSAAEKYRAELDGFDQVADLNAVLSRYEAFTKGVMTGVGPMKGGDEISQSYPFPGRSSLKSRIVVENAKMAALTLNITVRDQITATRKAFWDLKLVHEKLEIFKETLVLFEHLHDIASTMYKTGKTSYQDVIQVSIKKKLLKNEIESLIKKQQVVGAKLLALLDLPRNTALGRTENRLPKVKMPGASSLIDQALEKRQELQRLDHAIAKMELMIEMAESMVLPSLDMGLSKNSLADINTAGTWSQKEAFPDQGPQASMGAGLPQRPWFGTSESWLSQTRKKLSALGHKRENIKAQTRASVQAAWFNLDDAVRTYHLYKRSIIDLSASALDVSTREYEAGSVSFAQTADAYNTWLTARLSFSTAKRDAGVYRADLQKAVGFSF
ncbi:MAG: TolC family protein [Desulfobacter sp.]|nr:TolC family protein [Desulfobacter sp.]